MSETKQLESGDVLIPQAIDRPGHEPIQHFMAALGGNMDTWIGIDDSMGDLVYGLVLGKEFFTPNFDPSWSTEQLAEEIKSGAWKHVKFGDPEYFGEIKRRSVMMFKGLGQMLTDTQTPPQAGTPIGPDLA